MKNMKKCQNSTKHQKTIKIVKQKQNKYSKTENRYNKQIQKTDKEQHTAKQKQKTDTETETKTEYGNKKQTTKME